MPTNININNITGATPFNIYLCYSSNTSCIYINTISSSSLPYNFQVPSVMEGELSYKLKVIDNSGCVFYQDVPIGSCSPSPTPTMTPTPTPTSTETPTQTPTPTPTSTPTSPQSECIDSGMSGYSFTNVVC